jgi:hypothetical protein
VITIGTASVPANSTVAVFALPPGYCNFTIYQPSTPQSVYIGPGSVLTITNGMIVTNTPVNSENYSPGRGTMIYATTGNATASTFCYIISSTG